METNNTKSFEALFTEMRYHGMKLPSPRVSIHVENAKEILKNAFDAFLRYEHRQPIWIPEYDQVADWLTDNKGRGLFLYGNCGRGKSLLCRYILPAVLLHYCQKVVSVYDMIELNRDIDTALTKHIIALDDVGTEGESVKYGEKRLAVAEVIDAAEKHGKLLIMSSNLTADKVREYYGERVLDRIKSLTTRIMFTGKSLRE